MGMITSGNVALRTDLWSLRERREHPRIRNATFAFVATFVGALAILLASCSASTTGAHSATPTPLPVADTQQVFHGQIVGKDLPTLDPALAQDPVSEEQTQLIFPPLVTLDSAQHV